MQDPTLYHKNLQNGKNSMKQEISKQPNGNRKCEETKRLSNIAREKSEETENSQTSTTSTIAQKSCRFSAGPSKTTSGYHSFFCIIVHWRALLKLDIVFVVTLENRITIGILMQK